MKPTALVVLFLIALLTACGGEDLQSTGEDPEPMSKEEAANLPKSDSLLDICEVYEWYGDGVCDEFCPQPDPDCEVEEEIEEQGPFGFVEFFDRFNGADLPACGTFELCWYNYDSGECTSEQPPEGMHKTIDFRTNRNDPSTSAYLAMNREENLTIEVGEDGLDRIFYDETFPKSMPPGPGSEVGFLTRYTLTIEARGSDVERLTIYQEDYDPRTDSWEPWFDIRFRLDNPLICGD